MRSNICPSNNVSISGDKEAALISCNVVFRSVFTCNTIFGITVSKSLLIVNMKNLIYDYLYIYVKCYYVHTYLNVQNLTTH